jgi:indole-3-glycerol phosphate synthase
MNILEQIVAQKRRELQIAKKDFPEVFLRDLPGFDQQGISLKAELDREHSSGIIAEFKRKSPSKGWINENAWVRSVVSGYEEAGAAAVSILTDEGFFGGKLFDITEAKADDLLGIPVLRKDFIIDEYQVTESKIWGADVILLIAAILSREEVKNFSRRAKQIGLEVLLEIHDEKEIGHICDDIDFVGVNNRDLTTFEVDINRSILLAPKIPSGKLLISESGLNSPADVIKLEGYGFKGFLIGETFMKMEDPGLACENFIMQLGDKTKN